MVEIIENSVQLKWEKPKNTGNTELNGYTVEKRDSRCDIWYFRKYYIFEFFYYFSSLKA